MNVFSLLSRSQAIDVSMNARQFDIPGCTFITEEAMAVIQEGSPLPGGIPPSREFVEFYQERICGVLGGIARMLEQGKDPNRMAIRCPVGRGDAVLRFLHVPDAWGGAPYLQVYLQGRQPDPMPKKKPKRIEGSKLPWDQ